MRHFVSRSSILVGSICLLATVVGQTQTLSVDTLPRVTVRGNQFVNPDGETMVFRGLNTSDPDKLERQGRWNARYFDEIKSWGANLVRFPIHPRAWRNRGSETYLALLDQGIQWATERQLYVVLDWHSIGNLRSELFQHEMYETTRKETFEFWRLMAKTYGQNPTVAFYELYNEPTLYGHQLGTCTWSQWREILEEIIIIIRANGGTGTPLVAGFNWAYDLTPAKFEPVAAEGVAYVSHPYPQKRPHPWQDQWTADWGFIKNHYPLMLTEIGFCEPEAKGAHIPVISDESYGRAITDYCDQRDISYVVWVFDPDWSPMLFLDWNFRPSRQGRFFKKKLQSYSP